MRYGVIRTQKERAGGVFGFPTHWLMRGTLVRILRDKDYGTEVETMYPVFGAPFFNARYAVRTQYVKRHDYYELPRWLGPLLEWFAPKFQRAREWLCLA